jgi:hypothetical protein
MLSGIRLQLKKGYTIIAPIQNINKGIRKYKNSFFLAGKKAGI